MIANSYEWKDELFGCDFLAAPVSLFKHAPLHEMWDNTFEGMKVEVKNIDGENTSEKLNDYFWVATVLKVSFFNKTACFLWQLYDMFSSLLVV